MEFLSQNHLSQYEEIINQIQNEHAKSQRLKQDIDTAQNRLVISNLSKSKTHNCKIGHVNVKIFSDLFELCNIYHDEINFKHFPNLLKCQNSKYYLFEVYITNTLLKMIENVICFLNITVQSENFCGCKTIELKNLSSMPIYEVLAYNESIINCQVLVTLMLQSNESFLCLNLDVVNVDVSYHFEMLKKPSKMCLTRKLLEITKKYSSSDLNLTELHRPMMLEYEFLTTADSKVVAQILLKNSYHKIDLELFSELNNKNIFSIQLLTGAEKFFITFDKNSKGITIKSNFEDLCRIKKFFCQELEGHGVNNENLDKKILDFKTASRTQLGMDELRTMYVEVRKLWGTLPL